MAITKTQIHYLEDKLDRLVTEKVQQFKDDNGICSDGSFDQDLLAALKNGKVSLKTAKQIKEHIVSTPSDNPYYYRSYSFALADLVVAEDVAKVREIYDANREKVAEYNKKLNKVKQNILDKIVLDGVDVDTAFAELDKV